MTIERDDALATDAAEPGAQSSDGDVAADEGVLAPGSQPVPPAPQADAVGDADAEVADAEVDGDEVEGEGVDVDGVDVDGGAGDRPAVPRSVLALRRTRRVLWTAVAVALPVTMLVAVLATRPSARSRAPRSVLIGKPAPSTEAATIDGDTVRLADLRGRWVVVNFFATWCVPCEKEHPELIAFAERHKAVGDAEVLGVVYSDSVSNVKDFRSSKGGGWPMLTDPDGRIAIDFGVAGVPESFLIDPRGVIVAKLLGGVRAPDLEALLAEARAGRS